MCKIVINGARWPKLEPTPKPSWVKIYKICTIPKLGKTTMKPTSVAFGWGGLPIETDPSPSLPRLEWFTCIYGQSGDKLVEFL